MRIVAAISGNLAEYLRAEQDGLARQITAITNAEGERLRDELRAQVRAARLGQGLEKAWRHEVYPRGRRASLRPAALVFSRATVLHAAYDEGPTIRAGKAYLVIATDIARAMGYGEITEPRGSRTIPAGAKRRYSRLQAALRDLGEQNFQSVPTKKGNIAVLYRPPKAGRRRGGKTFRAGPGRAVQLLGGQKPVLMFVLVRQVRVRKVLDIEGAQRRAEQHYAQALNSLD